MKSTVAKTLLLLGMAVAFVANAPARASAAPTLVAVPAGTKVVLVPTGTGAFAALHNIGDPIDFTVKNPVIVNGWVVIPKGAAAHGTVSDLTSAGVRAFGGFSQASLHLSFEWVQLDTGKLRLDGTPVEVKGRLIKRSVSMPFGKKDVQGGIDPFLTAEEYGVEAVTEKAVHVATSLHATALEEASQSNTFIDK
ncbi:MAG: hypothetical protein IAI48_04850 [Candidatus Eremiobacteraeota bacterium]|nr:hypothetical protein [Candidatus Eremiobacteraeota bacterium]